MGKESNGVTMHTAGYASGEGAGGRLYIEDVPASERDTDPEITLDMEETKTFVRLAKPGFFGRLRTWVARLFARMSWRLMP